MVDRVAKNQVRAAYATRAEQAQEAAQAAKAERLARHQVVQSTAEEGSAVLSEGLREVKRAMELVRDAPDVRDDRVAELRAKIASGEYSVDSSEVAARMLGRSSSGD